MDTSAFLKEINKLPGYKGQVVHVEHLAARKARYGQLERPLPASLDSALKRFGAERLYRHQAQAINAAREGRHLILSTGTASGKTLAYNVPVLEAIIADRQARALYLFPTKALAQDQLRSLEALAQGELKGTRFGTYDGDTPHAARGRLRREASILLTNPDMLHVGILPNHGLWAGFFANLRFVVIDEAHVYRGVFGSHVANVLRRRSLPARRPSPTPVNISTGWQASRRWSSTTTARPPAPALLSCGTLPSWTRPRRPGAARTSRPRASWRSWCRPACEPSPLPGLGAWPS
jgi:DEAD/DEAH box helicase domain-containing protein